MEPAVDLPVCRRVLAAGVDGIDATVSTMASMAMGVYGARSTRLRSLALDIVRGAGVAEKDQLGEVLAVHDWVQKTIRYVKDPVGAELLTHAETLAFDRHDGDCDDHSILEAALLGTLGIQTRFVVVGFTRPRVYSHVYLEAQVNLAGPTARPDNKWMPLDPIVKTQPAGWSAPNPVAIHVYPTNTADGFPAGSTWWPLVIVAVAITVATGRRR